MNVMMDSYQPLFQRLNHDDYSELQRLQILVDNLNQRIRNLEKINEDLEYRLENTAKHNINLEKECVIIEKSWSKKYKELEEQLEKSKQDFVAEQVKNERLRDHLSRTERELYGILQRKYEFMRNGKNSNKTSSQNLELGLDETQQLRAPKDIRQKKITADLKVFLGL